MELQLVYLGFGTKDRGGAAVKGNASTSRSTGGMLPTLSGATHVFKEALEVPHGNPPTHFGFLSLQVLISPCQR